MTSLKTSPAQTSNLYGRRFFRDGKNKPNGWSLWDTKITRPERLDRLMRILAIAYLLSCGIGLIALKTRHHSEWSSSSKNDYSALAIARAIAGASVLPRPG